MFTVFLIVVSALLAVRLIHGAIYRLYLTPISKIPGPALAKLTYWYEFYYDVVLKGQYTWKIEQLHEQYGPIIRINPHEVHVADASFADTIFLPTQASRVIDKFPFAARVFGNPESFFGTVPHELHRIRRAPMNRFFTKAAIVQYESVITHNIDRMLDIIRTAKRDGGVVNLSHLYTGLAADVIGDYAFGESLGILDDKQRAADWRALWVNILQLAPLAKQYPVVSWILRVLPPSLAEKLDSTTRIINTWVANVNIRINKRRAEAAKSWTTTKVHYTLLDELLFGDLPDRDKTNSRLVDEAQSLLGAGSVTTAEILTIVSYHVLSDEKARARLQEELGPVVSKYPTGHPRWTDLETLPYLSAIIKETLRHYYGLMQRLTRVHRDADLTYAQHIVPRGTPISTSAYVIHNDKSIYGPDVSSFNPDRWLVADRALVAKREKNLFSFGKGTRMCLGYQLAYAELYLTLSAVFSPRSGFALELYDTTYDAIEPKHDYVVPVARLDSQGVKAKVM